MFLAIIIVKRPCALTLCIDPFSKFQPPIQSFNYNHHHHYCSFNCLLTMPINMVATLPPGDKSNSISSITTSYVNLRKYTISSTLCWRSWEQTPFLHCNPVLLFIHSTSLVHSLQAQSLTH